MSLRRPSTARRRLAFFNNPPSFVSKILTLPSRRAERAAKPELSPSHIYLICTNNNNELLHEFSCSSNHESRRSSHEAGDGRPGRGGLRRRQGGRPGRLRHLRHRRVSPCRWCVCCCCRVTTRLFVGSLCNIIARSRSSLWADDASNACFGGAVSSKGRFRHISCFCYRTCLFLPPTSPNKYPAIQQHHSPSPFFCIPTCIYICIYIHANDG